MNHDRAAEIAAWAERQRAEERDRKAGKRKTKTWAREQLERGRWLVGGSERQLVEPYVRPRRHTLPAVQPPTKRGARRHFRLSKRQSRDFDLAQSERDRRDRRHRMRMARAQKFEPSASIKLKLRAISDLYPPPDFEGVR